MFLPRHALHLGAMPLPFVTLSGCNKLKKRKRRRIPPAVVIARGELQSMMVGLRQPRFKLVTNRFLWELTHCKLEHQFHPCGQLLVRRGEAVAVGVHLCRVPDRLSHPRNDRLSSTLPSVMTSSDLRMGSR